MKLILYIYMYFSIISDETSCSKGWLGYRGKCYKIQPNISVSEDHCLEQGGYLAYPVSDEDTHFLLEAITGTPTLNQLENFKIFPYDRLYVYHCYCIFVPYNTLYNALCYVKVQKEQYLPYPSNSAIKLR